MRAAFQLGPLPRTLVVLLALFACANLALADGGRLRFREPAGPFIVTLFTTPDPLTKGPADFSVAVERADGAGQADAGLAQDGLIQDAHVDLILTPVGGHGRQFVLHASRAAATSKWLQAANFSLPTRGLWRVTVVVREGNQVGQCSGQVQVTAAGPEDLTWDVLPVPLLALLFLLHQMRKRQYSRGRRDRLASTKVMATTASQNQSPVRT